MTHTTELTDEEIARAIRAAREYKGFTQREMGVRLGTMANHPMTGQAYSRFEQGGRIKPADLADVCIALGIEIDDLADYLPVNVPLRIDQKVKHSSLAVPIYGTPRFAKGAAELQKATDGNVIDASAYFAGSLRAAQVPNDDLSPMVEQGQVVFFDVNTIARRGELCVVEHHDGTLLIRILDSQDGSSVHLAVLQPERKSSAVPRREIAGIYQIKLRGA